jgi:hypothetical protein
MVALNGLITPTLSVNDKFPPLFKTAYAVPQLAPDGGLTTKSRIKGAVGLPVVTPAPLQATVATKSKGCNPVIGLVVTVLPDVVVLSIPEPMSPF